MQSNSSYLNPAHMSPQLRQQLALMLNRGMGPMGPRHQPSAPAPTPVTPVQVSPQEIQHANMPNAFSLGSDLNYQREKMNQGGPKWAQTLGTIGATLQDTGMALNGGQGNALGRLQATRDMQKEKLEALNQQRLGDRAMGSLAQSGGDIRSMFANNPQAVAQLLRSPGGAEMINMLQPKEREDFTLGNTRFDGSGRPIVSVPEEINYNQPFLPDGTPNTAYQRYRMNERAAGASSQTVEINNPQNTGTNAAYESVNEEIGGAYTRALAAQDMNTKLDILSQNMAGAPEGAFANGIVGTQQFLSALGFDIDQNTLSSAITSRAGISDLVLTKMAAAGGARGFTREETQILVDAFPKLATDNASRQAVIQTIKDANDRDIAAYGNARSRAQSVYEFDDGQMEKFWPGVQPSRIPAPQELSGEPDGTVVEGPDGARYEMRGGYLVRVP